MLKDNSFFITIGYYLLFFPSITFHLIPSDIFLWAIIFLPILTSILLSIKVLFVVLFFYVINVMISALFLANYYASILDILWSAGALLNCICGFYIGTHLKIDRINNIKFALILVLITWIIFSIGYSFKFEFLREIANFLVRRGGHFIDDFSFGSRGISLLSTEPGRSAVEIMCFLWVVGYLFFRKNTMTYKYFFFLLIALIYFAFLNRSATAMVLFIIFISSIIIIKFNIKYFIVFILSFSLILIIILTLNVNFYETFFFMTGRGNQFIYEALSFGILDSLMSYSGARFPNLYLSYSSFSFFGGGLGNVINELTSRINENIWVFENNYYYEKIGGPRAERPYAFFALLYTEFGIIFSLLLIISILCLCRNQIKFQSNIKQISWYAFPMFGLLFYGSSGIPLYSLCIGLALNKQLINLTCKKKTKSSKDS